MTRQQDLARQRRRILKNARALEPRIAAWMKRRARRDLQEALSALKSGKLKFKKAKLDDLDQDLVRLFTDFGIRQVDAAGAEMSAGYGGEWLIPPRLVERVIREKEIKVTRLSANIKSRVLDEIRSIMQQARKESWSVGETARRMRDRFAPDAPDQVWALNPSRAALIARTESQQNEQTGAFQGAKAVGVEGKEWIASGNPNHGDRAHGAMDRQQRKLDEPFYNKATGNDLMYPGDPSAPILDLAQCGCGWRAIRLKDMEKRQIR